MARPQQAESKGSYFKSPGFKARVRHLKTMTSITGDGLHRSGFEFCSMGFSKDPYLNSQFRINVLVTRTRVCSIIVDGHPSAVNNARLAGIYWNRPAWSSVTSLRRFARGRAGPVDSECRVNRQRMHGWPQTVSVGPRLCSLDCARAPGGARRELCYANSLHVGRCSCTMFYQP